MKQESSPVSFLLEELRAGNNEAWENAYKTFYKIAISTLNANRSSYSEADLQDVAQEAVISLINNYVEKARDLEALCKMISEIAINKLVDLKRKRDAQMRDQRRTDSIQRLDPQSNEETEISIASTETGPYEALALLEESVTLNLAMNKLPFKHRAVLYDFYIEGLEYAEIAKKRGFPIGSIGVFRKRGIDALKPILTEAGIL